MISVTENAASQIHKLIEKQHAEATGLRVGVKAGGCSGFEYALGFDSGAARTTRVRLARCARVGRSAQSSPARRHDARLRHEPAFSRGFVFREPQAKSTCGCRTNFTTRVRQSLTLHFNLCLHQRNHRSWRRANTESGLRRRRDGHVDWAQRRRRASSVGAQRGAAWLLEFA
jgi:iron-sulfur cluster assembly protein